MNNLLLKDIADIRPGYGFREALEPSPKGNILVVQAKDIISDNYISTVDDLMCISLDKVNHNSFLAKDDVLLVSRGSGNHRSTVNKNVKNNLIASASVFIITVTTDKIIPEYLSLYLNSLEGQNKLSQITTGGYIQNIARKNLEEINISIPTLAQQKNLVYLQQNIWEQERLQQRKIQLKRNIITATLNNITKKASK